MVRPNKKFLDDLEKLLDSGHSEYDEYLLGPDDSHFWGSPLKIERKDYKKGKSEPKKSI